MSISITSLVNAPTNIQNWQAMMLPRQQDFRSLASSLKSGNLSGAQQAYSDLQAIASANASNTSSASGTSPFQQDFTALGKDLTAGNLSQSQTDFTKMTSDVQSVQSGIHHHGHHHGHKVDAASSQSNTSTPADAALSSAASNLFSQYEPANATNNSLASSLLNLMG
jgi:hypothetical protein